MYRMLLWLKAYFYKTIKFRIRFSLCLIKLNYVALKIARDLGSQGLKGFIGNEIGLLANLVSL